MLTFQRSLVLRRSMLLTASQELSQQLRPLSRLRVCLDFCKAASFRNRHKSIGTNSSCSYARLIDLVPGLAPATEAGQIGPFIVTRISPRHMHLQRQTLFFIEHPKMFLNVFTLRFQLTIRTALSAGAGRSLSTSAKWTVQTSITDGVHVAKCRMAG